MNNSMLLRISGIISNRGRVTTIRRQYVDDWNDSAFTCFAREFDDMAKGWPVTHAEYPVIRGILMIEIAQGTPEAMVKHLKDMVQRCSETAGGLIRMDQAHAMPSPHETKGGNTNGE